MIVFRSIRSGDLDALLSLARQVGAGMTTLKPDRTMLGRRIERAVASFAGQLPAAECDYVFVLEDTCSGEVIGVSALKAAVGLDEAFYNFRVGRLVHASRELGVHATKQTLFLSNDFTGSAELCTLFLAPAHRSSQCGRLLSKGRLLFAAGFLDLFPELLIAEMRGWQREDGSSPFWESLGRHFFRMDFAEADDISSLGPKSFIAELMPRYPVYTDFLTDAAREVIGVVHRDTAPARRLLEQEGLLYEGFVDIFDAGPVLQGHIKQLRITRESVLAIARSGGPTPRSGGAPVLVSNTVRGDFRVIVSSGQPAYGRFDLGEAELAALELADGDPVRVVALNAGDKLHV